MQKFNLLLFISILVLAISCSGDSKEAKAGKTAQTPAKSTNVSPYPSITEEIMNNLWEKCTAVDFLFYELPVSMSQDDQASIRQTLSHVAKATPAYDKSCKAIGRIFFQSNGEPMAEAEIIFNQKCRYYVFYENGKPKYANAMADSGVQFMNKVLSVKTSPAGQ